MILCCILVLASTIVCQANEIISQSRAWKIEVGQTDYFCDDYEWNANDLSLFDCGESGFNKTIVNATNVTFTKNR